MKKKEPRLIIRFVCWTPTLQDQEKLICQLFQESWWRLGMEIYFQYALGPCPCETRNAQLLPAHPGYTLLSYASATCGAEKLLLTQKEESFPSLLTPFSLNSVTVRSLWIQPLRLCKLFGPQVTCVSAALLCSS